MLLIVVIAHHSDRWIDRCVDSLQHGFGRAWKLVLVDNGGNSRLESFLGIPNVVPIQTSRPMGFAEANNYALVRGGLENDYVCFLNQDTVSTPGWLDACVELMESHREIGAVIPLITNYDGTDWDEAFRTCARAAPVLAARVDAGPAADLGNLADFLPVPEITAAAMVVRTEALLKAGPFDPIYGSYYEDYDLCRRISAAGYQVGICTRGRVGHFGGSTTVDRRTYLRRARWIARNRVIYAARWKWSSRPWGLLRYLVLELPRNLARSALGRSNIPLQAFLRAQLDLLRLAPRLVSARQDQRQWENYLKTLGWPAPVPSEFSPSPSTLPLEA